MKSRKKKASSSSAEPWAQLLTVSSSRLQGNQMAGMPPPAAQGQAFVRQEQRGGQPEFIDTMDIAQILASIASNANGAQKPVAGPSSPLQTNGNYSSGGAPQQQQQMRFQHGGPQMVLNNPRHFHNHGPLKHENRPEPVLLPMGNAAGSSLPTPKSQVTRQAPPNGHADLPSPPLQNGRLPPPRQFGCCPAEVPHILLQILDCHNAMPWNTAPLLEHLLQFKPYVTGLCSQHLQKYSAISVAFLLEAEAARSSRPVTQTSAFPSSFTAAVANGVPSPPADDQPPSKRQRVDGPSCHAPYYDCAVACTPGNHCPSLDRSHGQNFEEAQAPEQARSPARVQGANSTQNPDHVQPIASLEGPDQGQIPDFVQRPYSGPGPDDIQMPAYVQSPDHSRNSGPARGSDFGLNHKHTQHLGPPLELNPAMATSDAQTHDPIQRPDHAQHLAHPQQFAHAQAPYHPESYEHPQRPDYPHVPDPVQKSEHGHMPGLPQHLPLVHQLERPQHTEHAQHLDHAQYPVPVQGPASSQGNERAPMLDPRLNHAPRLDYSGPMPAHGQMLDHTPRLDQVRDNQFRLRVMHELQAKPTLAKGKSHGDCTGRLVLRLLQLCQSPDETEAYVLTGQEAAARMEAGPPDCPIFTEGQQLFSWAPDSRPIEQMFRRMENLDRSVSVQVPSRKSHYRTFEKHKLLEIQQRFLESGNMENDDPWNILDLSNPLPPTTMPKFLAGENCQLLPRVRDAVLGGSSGERTVAAKEKWNEWLNIMDWVLMSEGGHHTAPHTDSHGLSTWITVQEGLFGFGWLSRPTKEEKDAWITNPHEFSGGRWRFTVLTPGKTVFFPSGTVHFVFRLRHGQTLALGGHILQWNGVERWINVVREQMRSPHITNEDVEWSAPKYVKVIADLVKNRVTNGRVAELGGKEMADRFLKLVEEFEQEFEKEIKEAKAAMAKPPAKKRKR